MLSVHQNLLKSQIIQLTTGKARGGSLSKLFYNNLVFDVYIYMMVCLSVRLTSVSHLAWPDRIIFFNFNLSQTTFHL